jgi:hypothetical protein
MTCIHLFLWKSTVTNLLHTKTIWSWLPFVHLFNSSSYIFPVIWYLCGSITIGLICSDLWCSSHLWNLLHGLFNFSFPSLLPSVILLHSHLCLLIVHLNVADIFSGQRESCTKCTQYQFLFQFVIQYVLYRHFFPIYRPQ